ncbi:hypothetical protein, partial [Stenotrophomonas maltophilia]|uniref:hypothetical protein n=1 Tax=Stenotrophomonas maltophilia TaxID=40324 RepID=UPI0039C293B4
MSPWKSTAAPDPHPVVPAGGRQPHDFGTIPYLPASGRHYRRMVRWGCRPAAGTNGLYYYYYGTYSGLKLLLA